MSHRTRSQSQPNVGPSHPWAKWYRCVLGLSAVGLCGLCSCSALERPQPRDPFQADPETRAIDTPTSVSVPGRAKLSVNVRSQTTIRSQSEEQSSVEFTQHAATSRRRPANAAQPSTVARKTAAPRTGIRQVSDENARVYPNTDRAIERVAASARTPANQPNQLAAGPVSDGEEASSTNYPDEYIFDGGDRAYPITRDNDQFRGIETEDTIAQYQDHEGRSRVKKSNRVAIYAPRFGSVVTISNPNADTVVDKVSGHMVAQRGVGLRSREGTSERRQNLATVRVQTRSRANGLGTEVGTDSLKKEINREVGISVTNTHENRGQLRKSEFRDNLKASSAQGRLFAELWSRQDFPVIEGHASAATQTVTLQATAEYVGLEDNGKRGDLRLTKTADRGEANIGDVITFTIHYENRGDKELKNVVIIDNLSPRLEFDPASVTMDLPGKHTAEDNEEGSVILKFTLDKPLPGRTKGSVVFRAQVK